MRSIPSLALFLAPSLLAWRTAPSRTSKHAKQRTPQAPGRVFAKRKARRDMAKHSRAVNAR